LISSFFLVPSRVFTVAFLKHISWNNLAHWFIQVDELSNGFEEIDRIISGCNRVNFVVIGIDAKSDDLIVFLIDPEGAHKIHPTVVTNLIEVSFKS
jgi:hypothetical protein